LVVQTSHIAKTSALFSEQLYLDFSWGFPTGRLYPVTALAAFPEEGSWWPEKAALILMSQVKFGNLLNLSREVTNSRGRDTSIAQNIRLPQ